MNDESSKNSEDENDFDFDQIIAALTSPQFKAHAERIEKERWAKQAQEKKARDAELSKQALNLSHLALLRVRPSSPFVIEANLTSGVKIIIRLDGSEMDESAKHEKVTELYAAIIEQGHGLFEVPSGFLIEPTWPRTQ